MKLQRLYSITRKAIEDFHMIEQKDRIAIGISGGKDSLTLLYALHGIMKFYPKKFEIVGITVDLGFDNLNLTEIKRLCEKLKIPYYIVNTEIAEIVFEARKESNPCSLCAKMRKGALNRKAIELNCNKIAYAHHKDDVIETMMLSLLYEGRFHCFSPYTYLNKANLTLIRPLLYIDESDVIGFQHKYELPVIKSPCPMDGNTKREYVKNLIRKLDQESPGIKERMFHAVLNGNLQGWPQISNSSETGILKGIGE